MCLFRGTSHVERYSVNGSFAPTPPQKNSLLRGKRPCFFGKNAFVCRGVDLACATLILQVTLFSAVEILTFGCNERRRLPRSCQGGFSHRTKIFCSGITWSSEKHLLFAKKACDCAGCDRRREEFVFAPVSCGMAFRLRALRPLCIPSTGYVFDSAFSRCAVALLRVLFSFRVLVFALGSR